MGSGTYPKNSQVWLARVPNASDPGLNSPQSCNLEILIKKLAHSDSAALGELYDSVSVPLYSMAFAMLHEEECACQVLQETFSWVWHNAHQFEHVNQSAFTWLVGLVRQRALAYSQKSRWRKPIDPYCGKIDPLLDYDPGKTATAPVSEITEAFRCLSEGQQRVLKLAFFGGFDQQGLAKQLGVTPELVRKLAASGLIKFREVLPKSKG